MKIDITISGGRASGKTTMAQFLYSILVEHGFDIKIFDDGNHEVDISEIDVNKFDKFTPLKSDVRITVKESADTIMNDVQNKFINNITGTKSFNEIKDKLFTKTNEEK